MDWTQAFTIMGVFIGGFLYMMSRIDSNQKQNNEKMDNIQKELNEKMDSHQKQNNEKMDNIQKELNEKMDSHQKQNNEKFDMINQRFNSLENKVNTLEVEIRAEMRNMNQRLSTIEGYLVPRKIFRIEEIDHKDQPKEN